MLVSATEPAMPTKPEKPLIVISYAHADEPEHPAECEVKWLSFVTGYLRPAIKHGAVDLWLDRMMPGGSHVDPEIERKLRACDIFLLLVSRHSLSSDYVVDKEIAIIRERQARGEAVHFYPLVLTPTPRIALDLVRDKNLRPRDGKPFSDYSLNERYRHMAEAADEIAEIAAKIRPRVTRPNTAATTDPGATRLEQPEEIGFSDPKPEIDDKDSLESWLKGQSHEVALTIAARATLRTPLVRNWFVSPLAIFRAAAVARLAGKYPARAKELRAAASAAYHAANGYAQPRQAGEDRDAVREAFAAAALTASAVAKHASQAASIAASAVESAANATRLVGGAHWYKVFNDALVSPKAPDHPSAAEAYAKREADAYTAAVNFSERSNFWHEIRADVSALLEAASDWVADLPLWSAVPPDWARKSPVPLKFGLRADDEQDVWIDWYNDRLRGGSRGEAYELVFASAPINVWEKGQAAVSAWIRSHLPKE